MSTALLNVKTIRDINLELQKTLNLLFRVSIVSIKKHRCHLVKDKKIAYLMSEDDFVFIIIKMNERKLYCIRVVFHYAEFFARNDIFFCILTLTLRQSIFKQKETSLRAENSA